MKARLIRLCWRTIIVLCAAYLVSFAVLAWMGGYVMVPSGYFRPPWLAGLSSTDTLVWQPRYGTFYLFHSAMDEDGYQADALGYFYSPLTVLVQRSIRPSVRFVLADGSTPSPRPALPRRRELHPNVQRELP